jgi:ATP-dependent 26S proteasome regulatory subunit
VISSSATRAFPARAPYESHRELLLDEIRALRMRLRAVKQHVLASPEVFAPSEWPREQIELEATIDRRIAASDLAHHVPMARLRASFELTASEERILWTLIAHELCSICRGLLRDLNTETLADPTTDTLRRVVYDELGTHASWRELAEDGRLRRLGFIERTDGTASIPLERQTWKASDRVLALVHGDTELDPQLARIASPLGPMISADLAVAGDALEQIRRACTSDGIVIVFGPVGTGRRSCLIDALLAGGRSALLVDGRAIAKERAAAERELRAIRRECVLLGYTPLVSNLDALAGSGEIADRIDLVESELSGLVTATASSRIARSWTRRAHNIELRPLPATRRAELWQRAIPTLAPAAATELATLYPIAPALIHGVGALVSSHARPSKGPITDALRSIVDDRLAGIATRVTVTQTWDDVVLPNDQLAAIAELLARIRERTTVNEKWGFAPTPGGRGVGVAALFSGPPGTGKTMTAGLIARELGLELYQVDISRIASKWIGETEKNLAALFDAADAGNAAILFDEADSLFAKRTDIKTSNDRYANQEVNFLLTRIESFSGIAILTTNHETAIDPAFKRRLAQHVQFPMPEADERKKLWRVMIPKAAPTAGDLRLERLAEHFEMSGGNVRNAAVRAAFLAASERRPIDANHLERAARLEYEAMGKIASRM